MNSQMKRYIGQGLEGSPAQGLLPCGVGVHHPASTWMYSPTRKLCQPLISEIFMEVSSHRHDRALSQASAPFLSPENGG